MRFVKSETINLSYMESLAINSALTMLSNIADTASDPDSRTDARMAAENIRSLWGKFQFTENPPDSLEDFINSMPSPITSRVETFIKLKYDEGYNEGYEEGRNDEDDEKYNEGYSDAFNKGRDEGYGDGYHHGYDDGFEAGIEDAREY